MGEAFNYTTPFRKALNDMAEALSRGNASSIELPGYEADEDFVEGTLEFGGEVLRVYYEHALSYLSLSTDSYEILCDVAARLQSSVKVAELLPMNLRLTDQPIVIGVRTDPEPKIAVIRSNSQSSVA
jgi:hypothetical protein